ncbi:MAG TPA: alpha/beta hydrolase, partial [Anaerolineales bacterium]
MAEWVAGDVHASGIKIHYTRTGGELPALVLAHGITDNGLCWSRVARALEAEYDIVMYDARGHGLSDAPEQGYTLADQVGDLLGLVQGLGLEKPALMGHSMGALTVLGFAGRYPDLLGKAILEDPPDPPVLVDQETVEKDLAGRRVLWMTGLRAYQERTLSELLAEGRAITPPWHEDEVRPWAESKLQASLNIANAGEGLCLPTIDTLSQVTCPVLLLTGDPSAGSRLTPDVAQAMTGLIPSLRLVHFPNTGHNIRREQFERFVQEVRRF